MKTFFPSIAGLCMLVLVYSCSKDSEEPEVAKGDSLQLSVLVHENDPSVFFIPVELAADGQLTLSDSTGRKFQYSIHTGDNTLFVPYGKYRARLYGFDDFNGDTLHMESPAAKDSFVYKAHIARLPDFDYRIVSYEFDDPWYYLIIQCDTTNVYFTFHIWGCKGDTTHPADIEYALAYHRAVDDSRNVKLLIAGPGVNIPQYPFYNISLSPLYGCTEDTLFSTWYPFSWE